MAASRSTVLVAAIDFGTTFSGYGFAFDSDPQTILMAKNWGADVGFQAYKTPTSLLVDKDGKFKAFGFTAEDEYMTAVTENEDNEDQEVEDREVVKDDLLVRDLHLFQKFKMELHGKERLDRNVMLKSTDGAFELPALQVFAMSLEYLKRHLLDAVNNQLKTKITANDVMWVLTVPAIWTDAAKAFMKEAAQKAELVQSTSATNLLIALEPEAASLWCRTQDIKQFVSGKDGKIKKQQQNTGDKYMVIDAGGGTMDITVHQIQNNERVKELFRATGGPWGGIYVDKKLAELYDEIFGAAFMKSFQDRYPNLWMKLFLDWEQMKKGKNPRDNKPINLSINTQFATFYTETQGQNIKEAVGAKQDCGVKYANGMLRIDAEKIQEMFNSVLRPTIDHLHGLLSRKIIKDLNCIFIVGGFGESKYLQEMIISEFQTIKRSVLIPLDASICVIKGAVKFGQNPTSITSRIARRTYCFKAVREFMPGKDDPALQCPYDENRVYYLKTLVKMNTELPLDDEVSITTRAITAKQKVINVTIYSAAKEEVFDPRDELVEEMGSIKIQVNAAKNIEKPKIDVILKFGGTSMTVIASDHATGKRETTEFTLPEGEE